MSTSKTSLKDKLTLKRIKLKLLHSSAKYLSDRKFLELLFPLKTGYKLNLDNPQTFNEKLQWLKLYDRDPLYTTMVDKYAVKDFVAKTIGEEYVIPNYGLYNSVDEIDFDKLPSQFVLKCTHDSGGIAICSDPSTFDRKAAKEKLDKRMKEKSFFLHNREWPYKDVPRRIIAEKYMSDESGWQLKDYKVFCFYGEPKFVEVDYDRYVGHKLNVYDLDWNYIDFYMTSPNDPNVKIAKPKQLEKMLSLARKLAKGIPFVRTDFYSIEDKLYFGEMTFHPGSGFIGFHPKEYDLKVGKLLDLSKFNKNQNS